MQNMAALMLHFVQSRHYRRKLMLLVKPPSPGQQQCFAPVWAEGNYLQKQFSKKDYISLRNEFLDDAKGQRTGFKT